MRPCPTRAGRPAPAARSQPNAIVAPDTAPAVVSALTTGVIRDCWDALDDARIMLWSDNVRQSSWDASVSQTQRPKRSGAQSQSMTNNWKTSSLSRP